MKSRALENAPRSLAFCLGIAATLIVLDAANAAAQTVHAIIACPTIQRGGNDVATNRCGRKAKEIVRQMLSPLGSRVRTIDLSGNRYSSANVLASIRNCNAGPNDTIFVYVLGHGHFNPTNRWSIGVGNNYHNNTPLIRGDATRELRKRNVRLGILITESCAVIAENDPATVAAVNRILNRQVAMTRSDPVSTPEESLRNLFLRKRGTVDIAASSVRQGAAFDHNGPYLLRSIRSTLASQQVCHSWDQLFKRVRSQVRSMVEKPQDPIAISLPSIAGTNKVSLGVSAKASNGRVFVSSVLQGTPAMRSGLQVNDVVESINQQSIRTTTQFLDAVNRSPTTLQMVVNRRGSRIHFNIRLSR